MVQALLLSPCFIFLLLIISFIFISLRKKWGKRLLLITIILFYLFSITPVSDLLLHGLENRHPLVEVPPKEIKYVVVLDGFTTNPFSNLSSANRLTPSSTARVFEGIRLYNKIKNGYLILSGGGWKLSFKQENPCIIMKNLALLLGVEE